MTHHTWYHTFEWLEIIKYKPTYLGIAELKPQTGAYLLFAYRPLYFYVAEGIHLTEQGKVYLDIF